MVLEKSIQTHLVERGQALEYCIENKLLSANHFRDAFAYLNDYRLEDVLKRTELVSSKSSLSLKVSTRSISEYVRIMSGEGMRNGLEGL